MEFLVLFAYGLNQLTVLNGKDTLLKHVETSSSRPGHYLFYSLSPHFTWRERFRLYFLKRNFLVADFPSCVACTSTADSRRVSSLRGICKVALPVASVMAWAMT